MKKHKKTFISKLISLALCAVACLAVGTLSLIKTNKAQAENVTITEMHTLSGFKINEEAAIRREDPVGIRFTTEVSEEQQAQIAVLLGTDKSNVAYGTLLLPVDLLIGDELTHNTPSVVKGEPNEWKSATTYTVVLGGKGGVDLGESYYSRPIAARSYALNKDTGEVYYTENTAIRSIGYVAYKAVNDVDRPETHENVIAIATHEKTTKELVYNESVSIYNSENSGVGVIANGVNDRSANVFVVKIGGIVDKDAVITYESSDKQVVSSKDGVLTAEKEGITTITATATIDGIEITKTQTLSTTNYAPSSEYKILVSATAGEYETQAAKKLQSVLQEATGIKLAIVTESGNENTSDRYISIGETKLAMANCDVSDLEKETASRVKTVGNTVFIRGKIERATLYGVQRLLKDTVGYEYFLKDTYVVDKKAEFVITDQDYEPAIEYEVIQQQTAEDGIVGAEHAAPGFTSFIVPVGADDYSGVAHNSMLVIKTVDEAGVINTSQSYSNSNLKYKDWYATKAEESFWGVKYTNFHQNGDKHKLELCYTAHGNTSTENGRPALVETVANAMFTQMQKDNYKSYDRVAFSQSDHTYWCECTACTTEGNPSDNLLHFLLDVAASLKSKLTAAKDERADTFKICTLFYNKTNALPKNMDVYANEYISHMEIWFADIQADYMLPLEDTQVSQWNPNSLAQFKGYVENFKKKGADLFWWGYYASTACGFIPYDSFDALRANYALAADSGVDYMFNQAIGYNVNWTRLKQYLMSELRWNAKPDDDTWNGWIKDYMQGAFGQGADAMTTYFNDWRAWAQKKQKNFINNAAGTSKSIGKDLRSTTYMSLGTLTEWLNACNKAIAALDVNDKNYQTYYNNIILERLTPLYLIMYVHGGFKNEKFSKSANVIPYAQDFLDGIALWNVTYDGEGASGNDQLPAFKTAIQSVLTSESIIEYKETARQNALIGASITVNNANIASGEAYTATLISGTEVLTATGVTANDGFASLTFAEEPAVGAYTVVLRSNKKVITFTNVVVVTATISNYTELKAITSKKIDGYYVLIDDITDATVAHNPRTGSFEGVLDGNGHTIFNFNIGANGMFNTMSNATVKNITFENVTVAAAIFGKSATNTTFENVTVNIAGVEAKAFVAKATNVTYKNIKTTYIKGTEIDKTFFIPMGESEVLIEDSNLEKGDYTVIVGDEIFKASAYKNGQLQITVNSLNVGETASVICDNGETAYVYNVMRITKFIKTFDELTALGVGGEASNAAGNDVYGYYVLASDINGQGAIATTGYNWNSSHFQGTLDGNGHTVKNFIAGESGILGGLKNATVKNINFDYVSFNIITSATGYNYGAVIANAAINSVFENVGVRFMDYKANVDKTNDSGVLVHFYAGTLVSESSTGISYKDVTIDLSFCTDAFVASEGAIFGAKVNGLTCENVTVKINLDENAVDFGYSDNEVTALGTPDGVTVETVNNITIYQGDEAKILSYYMGDVTEVGFEENTFVQTLVGTVASGWGEDIYSNRARILVDGTQDYISVDFVLANDFSGTTLFHLWPASGAGSFTMNGTSNVTTATVSVVENGFPVTSIKAGVRYTLRVYDPKAASLGIGVYGLNTVYFGNVKVGTGTPDEPITIENAPTTSSGTELPRYTGDGTTYGWSKDTYVFNASMTNSWNDRVIFNVDSTKYEYMDVDFVMEEGLWYFLAWVVNSNGMLDGNYLVAENTGNSAYGRGYAVYSDNLSTAAVAGKTKIQVFDADGNVVTGVRKLKTKYTLRVYINDESLTQVHLGQNNTTILFANVRFGGEKPTEVVTDGSGTELPKYQGVNSTIGFADSEYVFEQVTTSSWDHRAHIGNNSNADFLVFDFSITNPSNLTVWFTRNRNVVQGYSNVITSSCVVAKNECAARTIYIFDENNVAATTIAANTRYTMWVYLGGEDSFHGIAIGNANATIYYANVRYVNGTGDNIMRQGDSNVLLPQYTDNVTDIGFEEGTFVQTLVGTNDSWEESISTNRARITADGTQDYISVDFVVQNDLGGSFIFYLWAASGNGGVTKAGECSALTIRIFDENGSLAKDIVAGKKYTLSVYEPGATYLAIGAYCNNTIYFANVTLSAYALLNNSNGVMPTFEGDVTTLGFDEGEYVQQMVTEAEENVWNGTRQDLAVDLLAPVGKYVSIMFSLDVDFTSAEGNLFFVWCRKGSTWPGNFYVSLTPSANARILGTNGEVVTDKLNANTVYMLELYAEDVDRYQLTNIHKKAITVSFATKSIKNYTTSIASSPITGSKDNTVTVHYGTEELGFDRNEVVKRMETETVSNVWSDIQATSGVTRASWLIKVASEAGKEVKIRFALSQDFTGSEMLFYVWAYSDNQGNCVANGSVKLSGSTAMTAKITDEAGKEVTEMKAYQVYELTLYCDTAIKYDIGNFVKSGMITYVSSEVTYKDYVA